MLHGIRRKRSDDRNKIFERISMTSNVIVPFTDTSSISSQLRETIVITKRDRLMTI